MSLDEQCISYVTRNDALLEMQQAGITASDFVDDFRLVWRWILKVKEEQGVVPSAVTIKERYPDLYLPKVQKRDVPVVVHQIKERRRYKELLLSMQSAAQQCTDFDHVDSTISYLVKSLNQISNSRDQKNSLVDLSAKSTSTRVRREIKRRATAESVGIPTGLPRYDQVAMGLQKQTMVVIIGRTGNMKSWLNLYFVVNAVMNGYSCILYPLEMNLFDTAARLYTIFSSGLFGPQKAISNLDIRSGKVSMAKIRKLMSILEDRFAGKLWVADMASLSDPYTNERIEAEVQMYKPDLFWVDYLTLLKAQDVSKGSQSWQAVGDLSKGIKNTAMRHNVVGGCSAQVNREGARNGLFLPNLEHIAYGDAIDQDADQVFSLAKNKRGLWYKLAKNRGGPEFGKTLIKIDVDRGIFMEQPAIEDEEEGEE